MKVDPRLLIQFAAVAEQLSFVEAARHLNISQPWLSKQIRTLEDQIGCALFERSTRHVMLTEAGGELLACAKAVTFHTRSFGNRARDLAQQGRPRLRVGVALYSLFVETRTALLDEFIQSYTAIPVDTMVGATRHLLDSIRTGELDVGFAIPPAREMASALEVVMLCEGGIDVLLPQADPLCRKVTLNLADLSDRPMAVFSKSANEELFESVFDVFGKAGVAFREYSDQSFFRHLERDQLFTALPSWQPSPIAGYARRPLQGTAPRLRLCAFRAKGPVRREVDYFWQMTTRRAEALSRQHIR